MFSFLYHCQDFYRTWLYICVTRWVSYKKRNCLPSRAHDFTPRFWWGPCFLFVYCLFLVFCAVIVCVFTFWVPCCDVRYDFRKKMMFDSSLYEESCLIYVICVFCVSWCPTHIILVLGGGVYSLCCQFPLDCPFLIVHSVFSNDYKNPNVCFSKNTLISMIHGNKCQFVIINEILE